jgi:orotate phosphoribosyltransferase
LALARDVAPILARVSAVRKSAIATPGERPTVQRHYDSFAAQIVAPAPIHIVLIDDVVTAGSTLLAAASRIAEAYPEASVRAFALIRTMSGVEVDQVVAPATGTIISPCVGWIRPRGDRALRKP